VEKVRNIDIATNQEARRSIGCDIQGRKDDEKDLM
jgi:hypothetical protein